MSSGKQTRLGAHARPKALSVQSPSHVAAAAAAAATVAAPSEPRQRGRLPHRRSTMPPCAAIMKQSGRRSASATAPAAAAVPPARWPCASETFLGRFRRVPAAMTLLRCCCWVWMDRRSSSRGCVRRS
eukprot:354900-Chlamydomonas_euryale.AAC.1